MNRLALIKQAISSPLTLETLTTLEITREGRVATIWFNKPASLNSISRQMLDQIRFVLSTLDNDDSVKIITIRSKHKKAFCVGADIKEFFLTYQEDRHNRFRTLEGGRAFRAIRKPIISIVEGAALGGGFQIALLSDIIICSEKASFGLPEINLGVLPAMGGTQILPRIVGSKVASRLILTGETINAAEAHKLNIAHLIQGQNFEQKLKQFLSVIENKALDSLEAAKKAIKLTQETTLDQGFEHQTTLFQMLFNKKCAKEGLAAFVQKRKPNFKDI